MAASITKTVDQQLVWNKLTSDNQINSKYTLDFLLEYQKEIDPTITTIIDQEKVEKGSILLTKNTIEIVTHIDGENSYTTQSITTSDDDWEVTTVKVQKMGKNCISNLEDNNSESKAATAVPPKRKRSDSEDVSTVARKHQKSANESSESKSLFYDGGNFTLSKNPKTGEGCLTLFTDGYPSNSDSSGSEEDEHT